jgi:hypothetical protein
MAKLSCHISMIHSSARAGRNIKDRNNRFLMDGPGRLISTVRTDIRRRRADQQYIVDGYLYIPRHRGLRSVLFSILAVLFACQLLDMRLQMIFSCSMAIVVGANQGSTIRQS